MVIGIRGESGAGKSTLALMLSYVLNNPGNPNLFEFLQYQKEADQGFIKGKWKPANFASTLKIAMATMYGIDYKQYEDGNFKDRKIGQKIYTLNIVTMAQNGDKVLFPIASRNSDVEIYKLREEYQNGLVDDLEFEVTVIDFTWRDTLNEASHGLHLYLGQNIALQAYKHRFDSPTEHLIMADVRKPKEIDLIEKNGGVVIWLKRNFVFEAGIKEVKRFFNEKGYFYSLADGNNPEVMTDYYMIDELQGFNIAIGIDCKPKKNIADTWLDGDDRADFIFHNPLNNPKNMEAYSHMLNDVIASADIIVNQLLKNDKA